MGAAAAKARACGGELLQEELEGLKKEACSGERKLRDDHARGAGNVVETDRPKGRLNECYAHIHACNC